MSMMNLQWDPCVIQDGEEFVRFLEAYLFERDRSILVIGGAGFDLRSTLFPRMFEKPRKSKVTGLFFREERGAENESLRPVADHNQESIRTWIPNSEFPCVEVFSDGGVYSDKATSVGGRRVLERIDRDWLETFDDIFVDISALSCGIFFPLIRFLKDTTALKNPCAFNLHLLVAEHPGYDHQIRRIPANSAALLHGYKGQSSLDANSDDARLWIPILSPGNLEALRKVFQFLQRDEVPIDVCPIIPFPSFDYKMPDRLVVEYAEEFKAWSADFKNILYAAESDPLDSYLAISELYDAREELFQNLGGSRVILSPFGNKMLSVGAMLAAIEKNLAVAMVESVSYECPEESQIELGGVVAKHVWLCGEAYGSWSRH